MSAARIILGLVCAACLVLLMLVTVIDVVGRYQFNSPILGAYELTEVLVGLAMAAALPLVTLDDGHVQISFADKLLGRWGVLVRDAVALVIFAVAVGVIAWQLRWEAGNAERIGAATELLRIPRGPVLLALATFFAASGLAGLVRIVQKIRDPGAVGAAAGDPLR